MRGAHVIKDLWKSHLMSSKSGVKKLGYLKEFLTLFDFEYSQQEIWD
jgi:hypothetical protein